MKSDDPKQGEVNLNTPFVNQHHRMAAGQKCNGQTLPGQNSQKKDNE